jgi:hypothetical protein
MLVETWCGHLTRQGNSSPNQDLTISSGADKLHLFGSTAGNGGALFATDSAYSDYEPLAFTGEHIAFATRTGTLTSTERLRITSAGLVGIGTSAPATNLHIASTNAQLRLQDTDGTNQFGQISQSAGILYFFNRNNVSYGEIRFQQNNGTTTLTPLTIDSSQRVGIGTTTVNATRKVEIVQPSGYNAGLRVLTDGSGAYNQFFSGTSNFRIGSPHNTSALVFDDGASERARIDSSGRLLVGTSTARSNFYNTTADAGFLLEGTGAKRRAAVIGADFAGALILALQKSGSAGGNTIVANGDGVGEISFQGNDGSEFVACAQIKAEIDATPGANDMPGRLVFSTTADGASSPTERMRIDKTGDVLIGRTLDDSNDGITLRQDGFLRVNRTNSFAAYFNRNFDDGTIISIRQSNTEEGSISVSGTTVSYNGAHLSRWSQITGIDPYNKTVRPEILRGTVMSNLDAMCDWTCPTSGDCQDNEQLNKTKISDVEGDKNVAGIFQSWDDDDDTWVNDFYLAMTGDFVIRIAAGTTVERGDLLMSAGDGTAKPQDDDIIRSKTIAKVTSTNVSCTYDDGSYCVPCVLMAC